MFQRNFPKLTTFGGVSNKLKVQKVSDDSPKEEEVSREESSGIEDVSVGDSSEVEEVIREDSSEVEGDR